MHHPIHDQCAPVRNRQPIVCPVRHCVMDNYFVENQDYIHPTHVLIQNHHLLNNQHYFPYMVSEVNGYQTQDYEYAQGSEPPYNWMGNMSEEDQNQLEQIGQGGMGQTPMEPQGQAPGQGQMSGQGQMPMMPQGQMSGQGQMPMMPQGQMSGQGQIPMMPQGQMSGQGQMPMMPQSQMQGQMTNSNLY